jgi:hypothetical protein
MRSSYGVGGYTTPDSESALDGTGVKQTSRSSWRLGSGLVAWGTPHQMVRIEARNTIALIID